MSKSALASLTAQYTDSENEDNREDSASPDSQNSHASQVIIPIRKTSAASPKKRAAAVAAPAPAKKQKKQRKKSVRRLVSYQDETYVSDDEDNKQQADNSETSSSSSSDYASGSNIEDTSSDSDAEHSKRRKAAKQTTQQQQQQQSSYDNAKEADKIAADRAKRYAHYKFQLPAEPKGKPAPELVDKIRGLYEKMKTHKMDMNRLIQDRKDFRNPSIYEKLIQFCDINEFGTNYPPEIYDPLKWGKESFYEELAAVQQNEMNKRQKLKGKEVDKIDKATALARKVEEEAKKRKSKWDQPSKPVQPLTTTVTGTKGTVISAFGSLPKKPAA